MMTSNLLSRLLPSNTDAPSIYETIQQHEQDPHPGDLDLEDHAGIALDEENFGNTFEDQDLDRLLEQSRITTESTAFLPQERSPAPKKSRSRSRHRKGQRGADGAIEDDDVPESLLLEGYKDHPTSIPPPIVMQKSRKSPDIERLPSPVPGPSTHNARAQWETTRAQQRLHPTMQEATPPKPNVRPGGNRAFPTNPRDMAMWRWTNVQNLDAFLQEVYSYYMFHGIWSILLSRLLSLLTTAFVMGFTTFLTTCIDYKKIPGSESTEEILIPQCIKQMHGFWNFVLWLAVLVWVYKLIQYVVDIRRLWAMHNFYHYLLDIPDHDIQTVSWQLIVARLMALRDTNPVTAQSITPENRRFLGTQSKQRMDAHDIANRLMRRENYMIALFNKDVLDLNIPVPFLGMRPFFTKMLEFNIDICLTDFVFTREGQVQRIFLTDRRRRELIESLRFRFMVVGILNILCAPVVLIYSLAVYFFRNFIEFQKDPSQIGSRTFTRLAEWKFREFNEVEHLFTRRKNMAYPYANAYLEQFPKDKMAQLYTFVSFIASSLAAVLGLATLWDSELFLGFELTPGRTVVFWLGVLTAVWAATRGPQLEEFFVLDPQFALNQVIECIHYCPESWKDRLHTDEVRREFSSLYKMKLVVFLEEILSIIVTPYILMISMPRCSERLIDFFREFTIHVDGLGHVCSFAVFDFQKGPENANQNRMGPQGHKPDGLRDDYYATKDQKMLQSYYGFLDHYAGTNGGRGAIHNRSQMRNFHPPPIFPALTNSALQHAETSNMTGSRYRPPPRQASISRTPRFGPSDGTAPIHSILLDPHHQPSMSTHQQHPHTSPQHRAIHTRHRSARQHPLDDSRAFNERDELSPRRDITTSRILEEDSELGGSWRTTRAAQTDDDEEDDRALELGDKGAGVLGLLTQFSKAQTEARGGPSAIH
ncbi:autophagy-related protein 9 [Patellaria atrata CBS 101060]|uniref:Autophagy-related protein 9 n=1 Tax=Patellaria atrata CBS 101060 TaxID=1346257 RepID=A0A9P4S5T5_9PEZI|nr:autophagy-related protein 9 [Patellaria atrata CBS 101060]